MAYSVEFLESSRAAGFGPLPVLRAVLGALLELDGRPVRLLDCGCGTGFFTRQYARLPGVTATGLDLDEGLLSAARTLADREGLDIQFLAGDITHLPFPEDSFDLVASDILLEIFPDKTVPIGELFRVCRPGGRVLCMEPNYLSAVRYDPRLSLEDNRLRTRLDGLGRSFGAGVELPEAMRRVGLKDIQLVPWLWGGVSLSPGGQGEESISQYLRNVQAELAQYVEKGLLSREETAEYKALFQRSAAARRGGDALVLHGIDVYLVCGRKPVSAESGE